MRDAKSGRRIAIVGMSCWYPGARSLREFWENILAKRQQFRRLQDQRLPIADYYDENQQAEDKTYGTQAAVIDGFSFDTAFHRIPKSTYDATDIVHWLALEVAGKALQDTGADLATLQARQTGVILGNTLTGEWTRTNAMRLRWPFFAKVMRENCKAQGIQGAQLEELLAASRESFKSVFPAINEDTLAGSLSNTIAGRICNKFDLKGGGFTVDGACSSSLIAVITAARQLVSGELDVAFAGGIDISLDTFELVGFAKTGALTDSVMRVYDERANGFIPGEGCGFVVLKRLEDAVADGDKIYSVIQGYGISTDGKGGLTAPSIDGQASAIAKAYDMAGYSIADIAFVEGHGTGTKVGDKVEISALAKVLAESGDSTKEKIGMTSLKSVVGHTKAAAGIGGLIKCAIALNQRIVPPMAGVEKPNPLFRDTAADFYPVIDGVVHDPASKLRGSVSAMGFGGINSHVTMESHDAPFEHLRPVAPLTCVLAPAPASEILVFTGHSQQALRKAIEEASREVANLSRAELTDFAAHLAEMQIPEDNFRATCFAATVKEAVEGMESAVAALHKPMKVSEVREQTGSKVSYNTRAPRIAFVYPGQGAQRVGMATGVLRFNPVERGLVERLLCADLTTALVDIDSPCAINLTEHAQPAITATNIAWTDVLRRLRVNPVAVAGHSLGELSAAYASGALDASTAMALATSRGECMAAENEHAGMIWLAADETATEQWVAGCDGYATIANINAPAQTVVAGEKAALEQILAAAKQAGARGGHLPVSNAFHSALMREPAKQFAERLINANWQNGRIPCHARTAIISNAEQWQAHMLQQMEDRVDFVAIYQSLAAKADLVVEVGPGRILTGLAGRIDGSTPCISIGHGSWEDSLRALADLYMHGVDIAWHETFVHRFTRPFIRPAARRFLDNPVEREMTVRERQVVQPAAKAEVVGQPVASEAKASVQATTPEPKTKTTDESTLDVIYATVADITGFEVASLDADLKLLDDLNMDSIKVTDLMQRLQHQIGFTAELGGVEYQNATLGEIAKAIDAMEKGGATAMPQVDTSVAAVSRNAIRPHWVRSMRETFLAAAPGTSAVQPGSVVKAVAADASFAEAIAKAVAGSVEIVGDAPTTRAEQQIIVLPISTDVTVVTAFLAATNAALPAKGTVSWVQRDDGLFGTTQATQMAFSAKAMAQSFGRENQNVNVRAVSVPVGAGDWSADVIAKEHGSIDALVVAGWISADDRAVPHLEVAAATEPAIVTPAKGDVIVVTGGGKGITAECALAFAQTYDTHMALIGSSPVDAGDSAHPVNQTIAKYAGRTVKYYQCDMTDKAVVAQTMQTIHAEMGPVAGIIHGAGINRPCPLPTVKADVALSEMAPKVAGMRHMLAGVDPAQLKIIVGLTSVIGVKGMHGNGWYGFANETLDLMLRRYHAANNHVRTVTVAYSVWTEVGMGARMGSDSALENKGIGAINPVEGVARFLQVVGHDMGDQQIVVTSRLGQNAPAQALQRPFAFAADLLHCEPGVEAISRCTLSTETHPYLLDHNYKGSYLFPTVMGLEAMGQVVESLVGPLPASLTLSDIELTRPIVVGPNGHTIEIYAEIDEAAAHIVRVGIRAAATGYKVDHFSATFDLRPAAVKIEADTWPEFNGSLALAGTDLYDGILFQGPAFQRIGQVGHLESDNETAGKTVFAADYQNDVTSFVLGDPYVRDAMLQSAQIIIPQNQCLPVRIARLSVATCVAACGEARVLTDVKKTAADIYTGSVAVVDVNGKPVEKMTGYQLKFLEKRPDFPAAMDLIKQEVETAPVPTATPLAAPAIQTQSRLLTPYANVADLLKIDAEPNGPQGQSVFVHRFIPDFKTFSTLGKSVYFSHVFNWMGWARELSSVPVMDEIRAKTETGEFGQVTNWANVEILGECNSPDRVVEARMWCSKLGGSENSSATLTFDWLAVGRDVEPVRIARGQMGFTWVEILGHGLVKPAPFPARYGEFVQSMVGDRDAPDTFVPAHEPYRDTDIGDSLFVAEAGPRGGIELSAETYSTGLIDANLVGNLYFGNYSSWMGKIRDEFFYQMAPELYQGIGEAGELSCVTARIQHLREAMPFDKIFVTMSLKTLHTKGADLSFVFYKKLRNGNLEKLAVGEQRVAWTQKSSDGLRRPIAFPSLILRSLQAFIGEDDTKLAV